MSDKTEKNISIDNILSFFLFTGILAFVVYVIYTIVGGVLWSEYNFITTDISSLGALGAPNQDILAPILNFYGNFLMIFIVVYMITVFYQKRSKKTRTGSILLFFMVLFSHYGYGLFPLDEDKMQMSFTNIMHGIVTLAVVIFGIWGLFMISLGYKTENDTMKFGKILLILTIIFTLSGFSTPIAMMLNIFGIIERLTIFNLHFIIGLVGIYEAANIISSKKDTKA